MTDVKDEKNLDIELKMYNLADYICKQYSMIKSLEARVTALEKQNEALPHYEGKQI